MGSVLHQVSVSGVFHSRIKEREGGRAVPMLLLSQSVWRSNFSSTSYLLHRTYWVGSGTPAKETQRGTNPTIRMPTRTHICTFSVEKFHLAMGSYLHRFQTRQSCCDDSSRSQMLLVAWLAAGDRTVSCPICAQSKSSTGWIQNRVICARAV